MTIDLDNIWNCESKTSASKKCGTRFSQFFFNRFLGNYIEWELNNKQTLHTFHMATDGVYFSFARFCNAHPLYYPQNACLIFKIYFEVCVSNNKINLSSFKNFVSLFIILRYTIFDFAWRCVLNLDSFISCLSHWWRFMPKNECHF